ncbi:Short-chain dehydrogenase/reductase phqE [Exophiala dermatitidis]
MTSTSPRQNKYTSKLAGTSVLVVGGTSGLGYGVAEAMIEHGVAKLYVSSSREEKVASAVKRLEAVAEAVAKTNTSPTTTTSNRVTVTGLTCDLSNEATLESNVQKLFSQINHKLDHIVFTAGDPLAPTPLDQVTIDSAKQVGMVRFFGAVMVAKHGAPLLNPGPASSITFTTGMTAEKPMGVGWTVISGVASGLFGLVRGLALELKPIRVNLVSPGTVVTELWDTMARDNKEQLLAEYAKKQATGRVGAVEDVVESYLFLIKDKNATGTVARSDGGAFLM